MVPRVLMPYTQFKNNAGEVVTELKRARQTTRTGDVIAEAIPILADFFDVSIQAAKIRMIDVGYTDAIGAYEYIDNCYVSNHSFDSGKIAKNQSFSVPSVDGIIQYVVNADLRRLIDSGNFINVDNHFLINDPKYVTENEYGRPELTEYASSHMDECCLVFDRKATANHSYGVQRYTECALFQSAVSKTNTSYDYAHNDANKAVEERAAAMRAELEDVKKSADFLNKLPQSFCDTLIELMPISGSLVLPPFVAAG